MATVVHPVKPGRLNAFPRHTTPKAPVPTTLSITSLFRGNSQPASDRSGALYPEYIFCIFNSTSGITQLS